MEKIENTLEILSAFCPLDIVFYSLRRGIKVMKKMYIEDKIRDIDRNDLFEYLITNRLFIESLSYDDLKRYYKSLKQIYKNRLIQKYKNILKINKK